MVSQVELKAQEHLDRQCLGSPLLDDMSVEAIVKSILINQGCIAKGSKSALLDTVEKDVKTMMAMANARDDDELSASATVAEVPVIADAEGHCGDTVSIFVAQQMYDVVAPSSSGQGTLDNQSSRYFSPHDKLNSSLTNYDRHVSSSLNVLARMNTGARGGGVVLIA